MRNTIKNPARTDRSRPRKAPSRRKAGKEEANLPERGFLRFQLGLILALFMVYFALEASFRMYGTTQPEFREAPEPIQLFFADLPPVVMEEAPGEKAAPSKSTVFIPEPEISETGPEEGLIQSVTAEVGDTLNPGTISYAKAPVTEEVPFWAIEEAPVFPGCEAVEKSERQACFQDKVNEHIRKHVRYPRVEQELHIEGKVYVTFRIQADGTIADIQLKGPSPGLEDEARRLISLMPVMTPGKQRGQAVRVPFSIPISFKLH